MKKLILQPCGSFDLLAPARLIRRFSQPASSAELPVSSLFQPFQMSQFALRANLLSLLLTSSFILLTSSFISAATVEAEGRAPGDMKTAREQALADALREAVRVGTGVDVLRNRPEIS